MRSLLSQPKSLWALFSTEMWERFAYFGTQSILTLYLTTKLNFNDGQAFLLFAAINALIYITPVVGGYIADRLLGYHLAALIGLITLLCGYLLAGSQAIHWFEVGMSLVIIGNGLLKPNISTLLGLCYDQQDSRRDNGFTLFYIGINLGATAGVILCGILAKAIGWNIVFWLSGSLLLAGVIIFSLSKKVLQKDMQTARHSFSNMKMSLLKCSMVCASILIVALLISRLLSHPKIVTELLTIFMFGLIAYLTMAAKSLNRDERQRLIACLILILFSVVFWMLYQQAPMSLMLFTNRCVNLNILWFTIPASSVWAISGIALLILAPIVMSIWRSLSEKGIALSYTTKFSLGIALMGLGYLVLAGAIPILMQQYKLPLHWLILSFTLQSLGELCLSPIGLAMVSVLAPEKMRGLMIGVWFLSLSLGSDLAGWLANWAALPAQASWMTTTHVYEHAFAAYGSIGVGMGLLLFCLNPLINKLSGQSERKLELLSSV